MPLRFEWFIALRYLRGKRRTRFINLITIISVAGVSVGVTALIVVMAVMTGFDIALRDIIIGNRAHVMVFLLTGERMTDYDKAIREIQAITPELIAAAPIVQVEALLRRGEATTGAIVLGVDPEMETRVTNLAANLTRTGGRSFGIGELPGDKEIVLGYRLASRIGARVGSEIAVVTDKPTVTPFGVRSGNQIYLRVSGVSQAKMSDFDNLYAFVNLETAQMLTGRPGVDGIHLRLTDPFVSESVARRVETRLDYRAQTWYESQQEFFEALKQEKVAMFIILVFIVLVAAFNITSTLIMIVMEKRRDIGILRTLGASGPSILRLFMFEGLLIGISGTLLGLMMGLLLAWNLNPVAEFVAWMLGVDLFNSVIYFFDSIPVAVVPRDVLWITVSSVLLTLLSTVYPAVTATRLNPVDALRYE